MRKKGLKAAVLILALAATATIADHGVQAEELDVTSEMGEAEALETESLQEEKNGWVSEEGGDRYYVDGLYLSGMVIKIDGFYYGFDYSGYLFKGTMFSFWNYETEREDFYRAKDNGKLYTSAWYDAGWGDYYYYGEDAVAVNGLVTVNKVDYLFDRGLLMTDYAQLIDGSWYVSNKDGKATKLDDKDGWKSVDGSYYYMQGGELIREMTKKIGSTTYGFGYGGKMYKDQAFFLYDSEKGEYLYYRADASGKLYENTWYRDADGGQYYYGEGGVSAAGLTVINDKKYYFDNTGRMWTSTTFKDGGTNYIIDSKGNCHEAKNGAWTTVDGYSYYVEDGAFLTDMVKKIGTAYYGFDFEGRMYDDTQFTIDFDYYRAKPGGKLYAGEWYNNYYYRKTAVAPSGMLTIGKTQYYFSVEGRALQDAYIADDGKLYHADMDCKLTEITKNGFYYEDANREEFVYVEGTELVTNAWKQSGGKYYYFGADGYAYRDDVSWIDGKYYLFRPDGSMVTKGWAKIHDEYDCYVTGSGALATGDQKIGGTWYHFSGDGYLMKGIITTETGTYLYGQDGAYVGKLTKEGWNQIQDVWFYYESGDVYRGYHKIKDVGYFFNQQTGAMEADTIAYDGGYMAFNKSGAQVKKGWYQIGSDWYYVKPDTGFLVAGTDYTIGGKKYHFDYSGSLTRNDFTELGEQKTVNADGVITSIKQLEDGWTLCNGCYYYFKNGSAYTGWVGNYYVVYGTMLRNTVTPGGYYVGQNGEYQKTAGWVKDPSGYGTEMYVRSGGKLAKNQWQQIDGKWYYFGGSEGYSMTTGAAKIGGIWYIFGQDGAYQKTIGKTLPDGWMQSGKDWYYFRSGEVVQGALELDGKTYSFIDSLLQGDGLTFGYGSSGCYFNVKQAARKKAGWNQANGKWYYFGTNYKAVPYTWINDAGKNYYQEFDGILTGYHVIYGILYYFDEDGALTKTYRKQSGWLQAGGNWYYFRNGEAVHGDVVTVGGKTYLFDHDGRLACNELVGQYYADANGVIVTGAWKKIGDKYYYFGQDGRFLIGVWKIGGKIYYLDY